MTRIDGEARSAGNQYAPRFPQNRFVVFFGLEKLLSLDQNRGAG